MNLEEIKHELEVASDERHKTAMFHFLFLKYAEDFLEEKPEKICEIIGAKKSMSKEIQKMRALYLLMKKKNLSI